jgi:proline iminopeptidase
VNSKRNPRGDDGSRIGPRPPGRFTSHDGLSLWYKISGCGPVLLVPTPGWGPSSDTHMMTLTRLEDDYTLIYFDTRGAGRSDVPPKPSGYAFDFFLRDLEALREHLGLDHWRIFAHSAASLQAMGYAIKYPKACRGLFIVDGETNIEDKEYKADLKARMKKLSSKPWYAAAIRAFNRNAKTDDDFRRDFLGDSMPLYFASRSAALKARPYFRASTYHIKAFTYNDMADTFPPETLAKIDTPTAIFVGEQDVITTPFDARRLNCGIKGSTLYTIKSAGHFTWVEQPAAFFRDFDQAAKRIFQD